MTEQWDAVVVGSGPNGLAAAMDLAASGHRVLVLEAAEEAGGAMRSADIVPGLTADLGAAVVPFAAGSPFFDDHRAALAEVGLRWRKPDISFTQPLDGGRAGVAFADLDETIELLGPDGGRYRRLIEPLVRHWESLAESVMGPLVRIPPHPIVMARYGATGMLPARRVAHLFRGEPARALVAGCAAHGILPLESWFTGGFATLFMASAHARGWPVIEGGTARLADAMVAVLGRLGGEVRTGVTVESLADVPPHRALVLDTDAAQAAAIVGDALPHRYRRRLENFRYGPGVCKVDLVLDGPVPWADEWSPRAGTVHVGGTFDEVARAEADVAAGRLPERPFVLVAQQDVVDPTRRADPDDPRRVLWAYTHVPSGCAEDRSAVIEAQIERFAPGFGDRILHRQVTTAPMIERWDRNLVGGDITAGSVAGMQLIARPRAWRPHHTPIGGIVLASASTPPGGGVHGMGGRWAARAAQAHLGRS